MIEEEICKLMIKVNKQQLKKIIGQRHIRRIKIMSSKKNKTDKNSDLKSNRHHRSTAVETLSETKTVTCQNSNI